MALIAQTVPARIVRVSDTNLYRVAADELGDAGQWKRIFVLNGLTDIWIVGTTTLKIPSKRRPSGNG